MLYLTTPLWVTEIVPPKGRSVLAGIVGLFGVVGYIVAAYVGQATLTGSAGLANKFC